MEETSESVFSLLTSLCEKFFTSPDRVKQARSRCYELLLGKRILNDPRKFKDLEGTTEPILNLLGWCYKLTHEFDLQENAEELQDCTGRLQNLYRSDMDSFNSILTFMLCLKDIPKKNTNKLDLSSLPNIDDKIFEFSNMFKLPTSLLNEHHSMELFKIDYQPQPKEPVKVQEVFESPSTNLNEMIKDEGYSSPNKENIWDIALKMKFSKARNWESYGCGPPDKEKPFLSELGELSSLWVENLESLYLANNLFPSFSVINNKMKPREIFMRDIKYLLVGMPSETFNLSTKGDFFISPGIMIEGLTPDAVDRYCNDFLFSGACYRALNQMATPNPNTRKYKYRGYVFTEFCDSLSRYLQFYRTAVMSLQDKTNFFTFHEKTYQIQMQISTLASVCKVGPYASATEEMPHGVALLNYLYQKVLGLSDKNLYMVLYSILYPCCQVYFSRFLYQWLLKGKVNDPHGEFFITPHPKYLATRGRTYWSRSYGIKADIIPDFLIDLKDDILFCGKIMNLLQLCSPTNKLCVYLMGKKPLILSCCLTYDQLTHIEQNSTRYYLEASAECGSKFSFSKWLEKSKEMDLSYLPLIAKKRAVTLRRLELERQKAIQEQQEKKLEELIMLKEQYMSAVEQKHIHIYKEIEREIEIMQENLKIEQIREKLVEEEAAKMISYYAELCQIADNRKQQINNHIKIANSIQIDHSMSENTKDIFTESSSKAHPELASCPNSQIENQNKTTPHIQVDHLLKTENKERKTSDSSTDSFYSAPDHKSEKTETANGNCERANANTSVNTVENSDILNANVSEKLGNEDFGSKTHFKEPPNTNVQQTIDNFEMARRIKQKVLGITVADIETNTLKEPQKSSNLTEAQRNKLKVLSTEFGMDVIKDNIRTEGVLTMAQINRNKVLGHNECFTGNYGEKKLDNENFVNRNLNLQTSIVDKTELKLIRKSKSLMLDFDKVNTKFDTEKPVPMSVDSTPLSELPQTTPLSDFPRSITPSSMGLSVDTKLDSVPNTADTQLTEDVFTFGSTSRATATPYSYQKSEESRSVPAFSKRVTAENAKGISNNSLKQFCHESVSIPLITQLKLANNEILKYFVEELNYLKHLDSLRDYFFLQDGEFGRNITENLFEKLYDANFPLDLINCRTLQHLVFSALDNSSKYQENSKYLSFKINSLPKCFDLGDPDVLGCLSLTYKVHWPLNILLPSDAVSKYDQVFKFFIKLNRVTWVLKKIFLDLKVLAKETGKKEIYLMYSPQYRTLHQFRHVMAHFMHTLQNYIVGEVLQPSRELFERGLHNITNIDELYSAHTAYIKNILFRCMLNQRSVALKNIIHKIFVVILKFYDYLRSRQWQCENGSYVHPNFEKLEKIFKNFDDFICYLFKVARKVAKSGYQPHLMQFLDVLNVNDYYSRKLLHTAS